MTPRRTSRLAAAAALALAVAPAARAAGTVTGVTASPSPAGAGAEVAITVTATGPCQVSVDFGDKQKSARLSLPAGPVKHAYAAPGKYVIKTFSYTSGNEAPGLSRCGGFADVEVTVNPGPRARVPAAKKGNAAMTGPAAPATAEPYHGFSFQKIDADHSVAKPMGQDNWSTTPVPSPTRTPARSPQ